MTSRLVIAEADPETARILGEQFGADADFSVRSVASIGALEAYLEAGAVDIILLSAILPETGAAELCRHLREDGWAIPILAIAAAGDMEVYRDAGCDEVFARPVRLGALISAARRAVAATMSQPGEGQVLGPYLFEAHAKCVSRPGDAEIIRLTEKETEILAALLAASGQTVSRESLLREVWRYRADVTTHTLETHVYRLRRKLTDAPALIITEPGGYRLAEAGTAAG